MDFIGIPPLAEAYPLQLEGVACPSPGVGSHRLIRERPLLNKRLDI